MAEREFDVIIVGAGPAGEVAAGRLGEGGLEVCIVERELVGGECSFYGCMPSKALLRPAQALAETRRVVGAAAAVTGSLDVQAVLDRRDEVIHDRDDSGMEPWLDEKGVTLIRDHATVTGERELRVGADTLRARRAVILAPGTSALLPPIDGLEEAEPWTNRAGTIAKAVPGRLLVLGGGVIGCELAQAWATLGSHVTLVESADRLISREEAYASEAVADGLREAGVELHLGARAVRVERPTEGGEVTLELDGGERLSGDQLLCAIGRHPRTDDLGVDVLGLEPGASIEVDERLRVPGHDWLYVIGDANGRALLTHVGKYQARLACATIMGGDGVLNPLADHSLAPRVVYTEPQVAAVGHTEQTATDAGLLVRCVDTSTSGNAGGSFYGHEAPGRTKFVLDAQREVLVGATFVGAEVQDFVHAATIAIVGEVPLRTLAHAMPCFPTRSEIWLQLMEKLGV